MRLVIYNILGEPVRTLVDIEQTAGFYTVEWDGSDDFGRTVAGGLYLYRITTDRFTKVQKMILLK